MPPARAKQLLSFEEKSLYLLSVSKIPRNDVPVLRHIMIAEYCGEMSRRLRNHTIGFAPVTCFLIVIGLRKYWSWRAEKKQDGIRAAMNRIRLDRTSNLNRHLGPPADCLLPERDPSPPPRDDTDAQCEVRLMVDPGFGRPYDPDERQPFQVDDPRQITIREAAVDAVLPELPIQDFVKSTLAATDPNSFWMFDEDLISPDQFVEGEWSEMVPPNISEVVAAMPEADAAAPATTPTPDQIPSPVPAAAATAPTDQPVSLSPAPTQPFVDDVVWELPPRRPPMIDDPIDPTDRPPRVRRPPRWDDVIELTDEQLQAMEEQANNYLIPTWEQMAAELNRIADAALTGGMPGDPHVFPPEFRCNEVFKELLRFPGPANEDVFDDDDSDDDGPVEVAADVPVSHLLDDAILRDTSTSVVEPAPAADASSFDLAVDQEPVEMDIPPDGVPRPSLDLPQANERYPTDAGFEPLPAIPEDGEHPRISGMQPLPDPAAPFLSPPDLGRRVMDIPAPGRPRVPPVSPSPPSSVDGSSVRSAVDIFASFVWQGRNCMHEVLRILRSLGDLRDQGSISGITFDMLTDPRMRRGSAVMYFRCIQYLNDEGYVRVSQERHLGPIFMTLLDGIRQLFADLGMAGNPGLFGSDD